MFHFTVPPSLFSHYYSTLLFQLDCATITVPLHCCTLTVESSITFPIHCSTLTVPPLMFHFTVPVFYILNMCTSDPDLGKCFFTAPVIIDPGELKAGDARNSARVRGRHWRNSELCITFIYKTFVCLWTEHNLECVFRFLYRQWLPRLAFVFVGSEKIKL